MYRQSIAALFLSCLAVLPFQASANESSRPLSQPAEQTQQQSVQINLNTASAEALEAGLLGIGPSKAKAIIEHRNGTTGVRIAATASTTSHRKPHCYYTPDS